MSQKTPRILVVDDLPSQGEWVRTTAEQFFHRRGHGWPQVELVHTQKEAEQRLDVINNDSPFDVVISDLCLTDVNPAKFEGYQVLVRAREKQPNARRILVSSRLDFGGRSDRKDIVDSADCVYIGSDGIDTAERAKRLERSLQRWLSQEFPQPEPISLFESETA